MLLRLRSLFVATTKSIITHQSNAHFARLISIENYFPEC